MDLSQRVVEYALDKLIESLGDEDNEHSNIIRESANRAKELNKHIILNGVNYIGLSFDDFIHQLDNKRNILLLSDEELLEIENIRKLNSVLNKNGLKITNIL